MNKKDADDYREIAKVLIDAGNSANKISDLFESGTATYKELESAIGVFIMKVLKINELYYKL